MKKGKWTVITPSCILLMAIHYIGSQNHHISSTVIHHIGKVLKITKLCFKEKLYLSVKSMGLDLSKQKKLIQFLTTRLWKTPHPKLLANLTIFLFNFLVWMGSGWSREEKWVMYLAILKWNDENIGRKKKYDGELQ